MKHEDSRGATKETAGMPSDNDKFPLRRLFYAKRCDNLIVALQFVSAVLRKAPAGGDDARNTMARALAEGLPPEKFEAAFRQIDATWAAWNRPDGGSVHNTESVERHARMALLAAVDQATRFIHLSNVARALARSRAQHALDAEDEALIANPSDTAVAAGLLDGESHLIWTTYGLVHYERNSEPTEEWAAPQPAELVRWLVGENGYPDVASKLTDEQAERLVAVWPKRAGRPPAGQPASWDVISEILAEVDLGGAAFLYKEWGAYRRRMGK